MAFTFIKALGGSIGDSIFEENKMTLALSILKEAKKKQVKIYLPIDVLCSKEFCFNVGRNLLWGQPNCQED